MQRSELEILEDGDKTKAGAQSSANALSLLSVLSDRMLKLLDYVAILRPLLLIPGWTMLLIGYYRGVGENLAINANLPRIWKFPVILHPDKEIIITLLIYSLLMGAGYILNQLSDSHTDEVNGKLYLVSQGYIKKSNLKVQIGILVFSSLVISIIRFSPAYVFLIILSFILVVLYSVPPVRLKGKPFLDLFANAFGFGFVAFAVGWNAKMPLSKDIILYCLPYVICISAAFINTTIPDIKGDLQNGDVTTGAFLGIRNSCIASTILVIIVPFVSLLVKDYICFTASVLSMPFFFYMLASNWNELTPNIPSITLATKVSLLVLSLLIAISIPVYFALIIPSILLVRGYYRMRFGIKYP
jgi:4-hydroxybenzoate polyprenyltransferase